MCRLGKDFGLLLPEVEVMSTDELLTWWAFYRLEDEAMEAQVQKAKEESEAAAAKAAAERNTP